MSLFEPQQPQPAKIQARPLFEAALQAGDIEKANSLLKDYPDLVLSKDPINGFAHRSYLVNVKEGLARNEDSETQYANADVTIEGGWRVFGWTPLHWAAAKGHKDVVELLLANKADADATESFGWTPLHWAANNGRRDVVELLLASKANVNSNNNNGGTPLHWAETKGHRDVVDLLLAKGADANARDNKGRTALQMAMGITPEKQKSAAVAQDSEETLKRCRMAAEQGDANAQFNLGYRYANGEGVAPDREQAVNWYRSAADQGNASAQNNLGVMYDKMQDYIQAYIWFSRAGRIESRNFVAAKMTLEQIAEAERLERDLQPSLGPEVLSPVWSNPEYAAAFRQETERQASTSRPPNDVAEELEEWKSSQAVRLGKISLPCTACRKECAVDFTPPPKCPHCNAPIFWKRPARPRIQLLLGALGVLFVTILVIWGFTSGILDTSDLAIVLRKTIPAPALYSALVVFGLAVIIPMFKYLLVGALEMGLEAASAGQDRQQWVRYVNQISEVRRMVFAKTRQPTIEISSSIPKSTVCWLHCRTLLCRYTDLRAHSVDGRIEECQREFFQRFSGDLAPGDKQLLRDLLWIDSVLYCLNARDRKSRADRVQSYASDTPQLFLAAAAIVSACDRSDPEHPFTNRLWLAEQCKTNAPRLSKLLNGGNPEACREAARTSQAAPF